MEALAGLGILAILGIVLLGYFLPFIIILASNRTSAGEKVAWILAVMFISWFAFIFYLLLAPVSKR